MKNMKKKRFSIWTVRAAALAMIVLCALPMSVSQAREDSGPLFTEEEQALINSGETLKVGFVCDRRPVSFQDDSGELAGISRHIFDRLAEISGLHFEYVPLPGGDITYQYLLEEGYDLVTSVEYNKENQAAKGILISDPYLSSRKVIVAKEGFSFDPNAEMTVAISTGSQTIRKVINGQYPNFQFKDYSSMEDCLDAVNRGEADLLIQNQYVVEYWLYKPIYNNLKVIPIMEMDDQLCFSAVTPLEKGAPLDRQERIISIINKSISQISDRELAGYVVASTFENMYEYTISDFLYQYRFTFLLLGIAFIVICVLAYTAMRAHINSIRNRADAKAKGDFLSAMSHEIRTPLNGLISLNYLMTQNTDDREKISGYLRQSSSLEQYLLSLVNNILDMSKLQDGKVDLEEKPLDLKLLLQTSEFMMRDGMKEAGLDFELLENLPHARILGDANRILQIVVNLLDNARKYTQKGGRVTLRAEQSEDPDGRILTTIQVADNGRGISEEFQKQLFLPFTQERNTVSQGNQGIGLGLPVCSLLAERMGGTLSVESRLNEGSTFTFCFPAKAAEGTDENDPARSRPDSRDAKTSEKSAPKKSRPRILIAEDNELNGEILAELLKEEGYEVLHVEDGKKALDTFAASAIGEYGVILMDLLMPVMNGYESTRAIRALHRPDAKTVKIFANTANTFQEDRNKAFESGMDDFIEKPVNIRELLKKLDF